MYIGAVFVVKVYKIDRLMHFLTMHTIICFHVFYINMSGKVFVVGDIHGRLSALNEVLDKSGFDNDMDKLISLGDVCDGGSQTKGVINRLLEIKDRVDILGNHDCLTPDSEALTRRGWMQYQELQEDDSVFSFNPETMRGEWMPITNVIVKHHDGDMISISTKRCKMFATPTHRVICQKRVGNSRSWTYSDAQYIRARDLVGRIRVTTCSDTANPGYELSDEKLKLAAWILTDGHITRKHGYITIYQSKSEGICEIRDLLDSLGYKYTETSRQRNITRICNRDLVNIAKPQHEFHINAESSSEIRKYVSTKTILPDWSILLSTRQFRVMLDGLIRGDGSRYRGNKRGTSILYGTHNFLSSVQSHCVTHGITATMAEDTRGNSRLNICTRDTVEFDCNKTVSKGRYDGIVWCIETPLTNFMVRYKGTCYFTGNSWFRTWVIGDELSPYAKIRTLWEPQGGIWTQKSYDFNPTNVTNDHIEFLRNMKPYHIDRCNRVFVHGGFNHKIPIELQSVHDVTWDRKLINYAKYREIKQFAHVFVGHTTTQIFKKNGAGITTPIQRHNLTMCDTGAGWTGRLSLVNVENPLEFYQSRFQVPNYESAEGDGSDYSYGRSCGRMI